MMATIRLGARLFKAAKSQITKLQKKTIKRLLFAQKSLAQVLRSIKASIKKLRAWFDRRPKQAQAPIPITRCGKYASPRKTRKYHRPNSIVQKKITKKSIKKKRTYETACKQSPISRKQLINDFYQEWQECYGPALTSLDKKYLEGLDPQSCEQVMANARLVLKSPYLKAVYNGLRDLGEDISDLIEFDLQAKAKIKPVLQDIFTRRPDDFGYYLQIMHDKGNFPTRSGERRLNLDPRLIPAWLGLGEQVA